MKPLPLQTIAAFCGGVIRNGDGSLLIASVSSDSRRIHAGDLFVALRGEKFDGHDFIPKVASAGAAAAIVSRIEEEWKLSDCAVIEVRDTLAALQQLAHRYRLHHDPVVIGITGSNGKTSTKDFTRAVMAEAFRVCATVGNLNNHIGLPLSILRLGEGDTCGVFEMGMNHPGELDILARIAEPDAAIITNIGVAHIEFMSTREAIASEKGTLAECIPADGLVVLNASDAFTASIAARCRARVITAGVGRGDVAAVDLKAGADGTTFTLDFGGEQVPASLPVPGEHMVCNAALAAAAGWQFGIQPAAIAHALRSVHLTGGRLETKHIGAITFLDDSYNANPDSMRAGLRTLAGIGGPGRRIAVLGRMGELGGHAVAEHQSLGEFAAGLNLDALFTVGGEGSEAPLITEAASARQPSLTAAHFSSHLDCAAHLRGYLRDGDTILLKGSRSAGMEKVLSHYQAS